MRKSMNLLSGLCIATCCAAAANAQDSSDDLFDLSLEELMGMEVEIATGTKKSLSKAPAVVTLITADDLKKTGYTNAIEALEMVPGIHVRFNRMGYSPFIHFRGTNTNQTLLMVNGQSMRSHAAAWAQDQFWKGLPVSAVERIEVIRGPGSARYEANASAGVINIITKTAGTIEESEAGVRIGEFNTQETWVQHGTQWNGYDVGLTAEMMSTDGHDPSFRNDSSWYPTNTTRTLDLSWKNADLRGYLASDLWRLQADYTRQSDVKIGLNGAGYFDESAAGDTERLNLAWLFKDQQYSEEWGLDAELRYQHLKYDSGDGYTDNTAATSFNQEGASEQLLKSELSGLFSGFSGHSIRLGGGVSYQEIYDITDLDNGVVDTTPFVTDHSRTTHSLFLQDVWQINEDWELTAGNRWDHYTDFGNTSNARIAAVWQTTDQLITKLMYGEGFRPLTFREMDNPHGSKPVTGLGEKTRTHELAFTWKASEQLTLGTNLFVFNIVDMVRAGSAYWNEEEWTTRGIEIEGTWQPRDDLRFAGNITARNPDYNNSRKEYEPEKDAYLRMDWRYQPEWNLNLQANWTAGRVRKDTGTREDMDNNFIVDSTVRYSGLKEWELAASIRNLFDDDALEHTGGNGRGDLPLPERNLFVEARYKF